MAMPNPSQPSLPDYYDVLGVDFNATSEEVRRAYFQKARQVHPDKDSNSSVDDWHILNKAYTTLTDSIQRQDYNEQLASSDTEGVPDLTRPTLPSTERLSEEFKSCFEHWTHLHNPIGTGSFNKAFIADLKEVMEGRCKGLVNHEKCNKKPVLQKRNISTRCNYGEMMKTISETVNIPMSSPIVQEVAENLLQIIKTARMSKTSFEVTGIRVPILDLTSIPLNDLWLLLHLCLHRRKTHTLREMFQRMIYSYI